ncbi:MAG: DNA polymerase III subunit alpha [Bacteroidales bacterium]|nr:DNA polymerase III subunit alpha [Bacteroidales bacterium]NPV36873.1 DNA polymerase III subunit alpha [Bacteroidales bacterium]
MLIIAHSYYSLRYGTLSIEELTEKAAEFGIKSLVLADINNTAGIPDFVKACEEKGITPIAGIDIFEGNRRLYTLIALNETGFQQMNEWVSHFHLEGLNYPEEGHENENIICIYPSGLRIQRKLKNNEFLGVTISEIARLRYEPFRRHSERLMAVHYLTFQDTEDYKVHRNLRAVDNNILLSRLTAQHLAHPQESFAGLSEALMAFSHQPLLMQAAVDMTKQAAIRFDFQSIKNKKTFTGSTDDDRILLEKLTIDGLEYRYGRNNREATQRVRNELDIIHRLGFSAYFLITWDIIRYSMLQGFYHVGRGSGANSVVAYCLRITDVDPIELNLYFERFINPRRSSPPDFDIDYSWKERDAVIDYIFKRYGRKHTALLGSMSTFRDRSIYRELGKVYGLPKEEIDELALNPSVRASRDHIARHIHKLAERIADFPNIRSIHAGGILISEKPITAYTTLDLPPKGFPTTQWDMYVAESLGFEKLDILSQRGIGHIKECAEIVLKNRGVSIDVHQVQQFKTDPLVKERIRQGETLGCFYIESPAMRGLLKKLRCDNYLTLVAASSIIRPGVARSGMMKEYIYRFHNPGKFTYIHPVMEEQLSETFGVMVYQEDVLKVCHHFAGLDLADADVLRRAMSGKFRSRKEMDRIVDKFFNNCRQRGYPEPIIQEVWRQIASFAGYSFSKAHSASYAVESYQSLYLKAHFPLEFMVAVINNFGGFYQSWVYFNEARRWGGHIELPCINHSEYLTSIDGNTIFIGFVHIESLETTLAHQIVEERRRNGPYHDLADFMERTHAGLAQTLILIRCGALRFTNKTKASLLWEAHMLRNGKKMPSTLQSSLFHLPVKEFNLPHLPSNPIEDAYDEMELLGFPVTLSWFDLLQTTFRGEVKARDMIHHVGKTVRMLGYLVTLKYVKTVNNELMHFGNFVDADGELFDTVHFSDSLKKYPFQGKGMYLLLGTLTEEFGHPSLTVQKMAKMPFKPDPRRERTK